MVGRYEGSVCVCGPQVHTHHKVQDGEVRRVKKQKLCEENRRKRQKGAQVPFLQPKLNIKLSAGKFPILVQTHIRIPFNC